LRTILLLLGSLLATACARTSEGAAPPTVAVPAPASQAAATGSPAQALQPVVIGAPSPTLGFLPVQVASRLGYFQEEGLKVEYVRAIGTTIIPSLLSGELHFSTQLSPIGLYAAQGGATRVVQLHSARIQHVLTARPEIASVAQLAGKRIAVQSLNTLTAFEAQKLIEHFDLADVGLISVGSDLERIAALEAGAADATVLPIPANLASERQGFPSLLRLSTVVAVPQAGLATSEALMRDQTDLVVRSLRAAARALPVIRGQNDEVSRIIADWMELSLDDAARAYEQVADTFSVDGTVGPGEQLAYLDLLRATGGMPAETTPAQVFDLTLARRVATELGLPEP
jgi:ABC-type nitrate/sulfonate/bicarbonate transport system substrate-binding protein